MKKIITLGVLLFAFGTIQAQDDLLGQLEAEKPTNKEVESAAFKGLQICNIQSTKVPVKNEWYMVVSHRFGDVTEGLDNFFGLDNALTKIGAIYGATNWLSFGFSRQTYHKTYELSAKYKLFNQEIDGFPFTIVGYHTADINSSLEKKAYPGLRFSDRMAYTSQLLISRKISESVSVQYAPVYVHKNLYDQVPGTEMKDQFLFAFGGRVKLTKRLSFNLEYATRVNAIDSETYHNPLTAGFDIETGGHVFQLVLSNAQQMNDASFYTNTAGDWNGGSLFFGFNMYRVF